MNRLRIIQAGVVAILVIVLLAAVANLAVQSYLDSPVLIEQPVNYQLKPGTSLSRVADELYQLQVINHPHWWRLYARFTGQAAKIQAGEYRIEPGSSHHQLLDDMVKGRVQVYQITLVEGWNFNQVRAALARQDKLEGVTGTLSDAEIMTQLGESGRHPEGLFFPDSYRYSLGMSDLDILRIAREKMQRVLAEEWQAKSEGLPYDDPYQALVMASIVEKETGVAYERPDIAGVFVRRLQKGMRLQTDPTVIYGLGDSYQGNLRRKHLKQPTPYNTYVIKGLPPTPIAMPGRAAIHAALHPRSGSSLYFVAKGDGSHAFSDTLEQHNKAVRKYQIEQRLLNYRSRPSAIQAKLESDVKSQRPETSSEKK